MVFTTNLDLLNPAKVDKLINAGKIKDYSLEENKNENIPTFYPTFIDTTNSETTGIFYINGGFLSEFISEKSFIFEIVLLTGEKALCTLPKIDEGEFEIQIECVQQKELNNSKIMIQHYIIFDGYNEMLRLEKIATEDKVNVANGK